MKKTSITAITLALALAALPSFAANTLKITVNGMVCAFCAQGIEKRINKMGATKEVLVDLKKKTIVVEAKDGQTLDGKAISAEIVDAGYDVVKLEPVTQSVADIKAEMLKGRSK
ncbi:heavy-metal-associated domain-containing protein [Rhodoferax sp. AJA081-3]|uniref:heavy-metal-associated domain-containing protein n=1 Tax=Rhodoferax sp. AJA081-3 TaxID=2752316 RepID=UPI001ADF3125|nr:heavy metal-associated domain-containing protein [Rhodoferax sp. AJA081-3]QTN27433.1 heavy-metal-associated domain-containing protein [Rhodoferax sp. AJA081-3]